MKKLVVALLFIIGAISLIPSSASAQMMGNTNSMMQGLSGTPQVTPSQQDLQDIQTGQALYTQFQNKQVSCTTLQDANFEKIGEYIMNQQFGNANTHIQMNERMKQMMGTQGEERMHIAIARSVTNCNTNNQQGGVRPMMGSVGSYGVGMMNGGLGYGFGLLWIIGYVIVLIDLILVGVLLWKHINKKH